MKRLILALFLGAVTVLSATVSQAAEGGWDSSPSLQGEFKSTASANIPWHAQAVMASVVQRLRGAAEKDIAKSLSVNGSAVVEPEPNFHFDGFGMLGAQIVNLGATDEPDTNVRLAARILFQDPVGRRTVVGFIADYLMAEADVTMVRAVWTPLFPDQPETEMFVVPKAAIDAELNMAAGTFQDLYLLAAKNSIAMQDAKAENDVEQEYVILVFSKDRISPKATYEMRLSNRKIGPEGSTEATRYKLYDDGWPVAVAIGTFKANAAREFFVKVLYAPGEHISVGDGSPLVVGLYSTLPKDPPKPYN